MPLAANGDEVALASKVQVMYRIDYLTRSVDCATAGRMRTRGQEMAIAKRGCTL